jgi:hypothetical protein
MDDEIRRRMKMALDAKRLSLKQASIAAGFGQTYLFDALAGRKKNGVRRRGGRLDNFEFIAQVIGLNREWLRTGAGPMWVDDCTPATPAARSASRREDNRDDPADLLAVIEEALGVLLGLPAAKAKAAARALAEIAREPPQGGMAVARSDALRISVRAILRSLREQEAG